jgi:hypothetical protein
LKNKNILVVSYSQSGQIDDILTSVLSPLENNTHINIVHKRIKPKISYPYPWTFMKFMDVFPETVNLDTCEIESIDDDDLEYDLVILSYQVWFLSPSIPITSFLKSSYAKKKLQNKPVITLIGCRNMWIMAQEKMKFLLEQIGAKLIDNIVLIDQGNSLATFITTPRWMLTGKKDSLWNIFPKAGVSEEDIASSSRFGKAILYGLKKDKEKECLPLCYGLGAVQVNEKLIKSEQIGTKSFSIWGNLIRKIGKAGETKRKPIVLLYLAFLILMIITVVPVNMIVQTINRKINKNKVNLQKEHYELPSGSSKERIKEFF